MKQTKFFFPVIIGLSFLFSCSKGNNDPGKIPEIVTAAEITDITTTTAICGGEVRSDGGNSLTATGVCWSTNPNPTVADKKTNNGAYIGIFKSNLAGLTPGTLYYARAYATNSIGTAYGAMLSFTTRETVTDIDGNVYNTVTIGTQTWMVENLKTTKYNDGTPIPLLADNSTWPFIQTPAYCWYNNDATNNRDVYGALYNWRCVNTGKLAPIGWHVPSISEVNTLTTYTNNQGLKESGTSHWKSPNTGVGDKYGFKALPGGWCNGGFANLNNAGMWWTTSTVNPYSIVFMFAYNTDNVSIMYEEPSFGCSIRCIKN